MSNLYSEVLQKVKIRDVIQHYDLPIIKNKIVCPFHDDHEPSMSIDDKRNIAKCFVCGQGANPISFIFKYENMVNKNSITFNQAVKMAAEIGKVDIDLRILDNQNKNYQYTANGMKYTADQINLLNIADYFDKLFQNNINVVENEHVIKYLESRNIDIEIAKKLGFGYTSNGEIHKILSKKQNMNPFWLNELGLIKFDNDEKFSEPLSDRLIIPIKDEKGNVVAFSGRVLDEQTPKYLHSKESSIFKKRNILYNFDSAKGYAFEDELYIVEGFMDVLGAKTLGIDNCVGLMGTEMTDGHIKHIKKCNCSVSLCLDNDQAGKNGMLKIIPKLFSEDIEVNVIDLSKLGDFKDLGEAAISLKYKSDIENAKVSGFSFLLSQKYFNNKDYSVTNIKKQYEELKYDEILKDTADLSLYLEYLEEKTNFTKDELNDIIFPKSIDEKYLSPLEKFKNKLLIETLSSSIMQYLMDKNDKVIMNYYNLHKEELFQEVVKEFNRNPENYMDATSIDINCSLLLKTLLDKDEEYQRYDFLNRFQYSHLFKKTYVKNDKGCAKLKLNKEQKTLVIKQYDNTLSEQEKLNLEDVSEMFIINKTNEIDAILPEITDPLIKETIKERMSISSCMQYFKFSTIFDKSMINYMDPSLLNTKGDGYKTILLVNNLNGLLNLSRENLDLEAIKPKEESIPQVEKQVQKDEIKEIHEVEEKKIAKQNIEKDEFFGLPVKKSIEKEHILVSKEQVLHYSEKGFFIKTADPNISIFAPIRLCSWKDENFTHLAITLGRKIFSKQTALSKYENNTFSALLSKEELESITKVINPSAKSMLSIPIDMSTSNDYGNCIHLPGNVNGIDGYFYISKSNINSGAIYGKDYFTFSFYDMDDKLITKIKLSDIQSHIKDGQSQEQVIDEREVF